MMTTAPKEGQIWADNDPRSAGRTIEIMAVGVRFVTARTVTAAQGMSFHTSVGRVTRVRVDRLRPTSTGYRLVKDVI